MLVGLPAFCQADSIDAITKPSQDVTLSFVRPGKIAKVYVKDGDEVKAGELLVQQDDSAEQAMLEQLKAQGEDTVKIRAAVAQLDEKRIELKKLLMAATRQASTELEVERAKQEVVIGELSLELAKFQQLQDQRKAEETKLQIDRMRITSPISGIVEKVAVHPGESIDALKEVVRVVNVNPLWIEVPAPQKLAGKLLIGQSAEIVFPSAEKTTGRIIHKGAVGDSASDTLVVRIEAPNPHAQAGENVKVILSAPEARTTVKDKAPAASTQPATGTNPTPAAQPIADAAATQTSALISPTNGKD